MMFITDKNIIFNFSGYSQCFSIPFSYMSLMLASIKLFTSQRLGRHSDTGTVNNIWIRKIEKALVSCSNASLLFSLSLSILKLLPPLWFMGMSREWFNFPFGPFTTNVSDISQQNLFGLSHSWSKFACLVFPWLSLRVQRVVRNNLKSKSSDHHR